MDPTDDTWEHKLPAFARPNNPTFFEVSADPSAEDPVVVGNQFNVEVDAPKNPY